MSAPAGDLETTSAPPVALDELAGLFARLAWLSETSTALLAEQEQIKAVIQDRMGQAEHGSLNGRPVVRWARHVRTALDQKALRRDAPDVFDRYVTTSVVRRFTVLPDAGAQ